MMSTNGEDFFADLKEWSERKLNLLQKYVSAFVKILGNEVYYVDGFAGEGIYGDGSTGSPVRIAELAQQYERDSKPYSLKCINIEDNPDSFSNLVKTTGAFGNRVINLRGTFGENVDQVIKEIGTQPAVCFLDPFGIKGIELAAIEKIVTRKAATDLWIRFDTKIIRRLDGSFRSEANSADKKFDVLLKVFGMKDRDLLHTKLDGATAEDRVSNAVRLYMERLTSIYTRIRGAGYAGAYPIRSLKEQHKYFLVFATGHSKGIFLTSEVVCGVEETYQHELQDYREEQRLRRTGMRLLFDLDPTEEQIFDDKVKRLKEDIWMHCQGKKLSRKEIYRLLLKSWFGRIKGRHLTAALKMLHEDGSISKIDGRTSDESTIFSFRKSN